MVQGAYDIDRLPGRSVSATAAAAAAAAGYERKGDEQHWLARKARSKGVGMRQLIAILQLAECRYSLSLSLLTLLSLLSCSLSTLLLTLSTSLSVSLSVSICLCLAYYNPSGQLTVYAAC